MQKYEIPQNCPFSLPFPTVIAFHRVKKSPLIIGIVDRIKINSEQLLPFSKSKLSIPYFLQIVLITYVCFVYFVAIAQVCINSISNMYGLLYSDGVKGDPSPTCLRKYREQDRRSRGEKGNQGVGDFRFYKYFTIFFYILLLLFSHTFFTHDIYLHPQPTPTTQDLYPLPTTHDI